MVARVPGVISVMENATHAHDESGGVFIVVLPPVVVENMSLAMLARTCSLVVTIAVK